MTNHMTDHKDGEPCTLPVCYPDTGMAYGCYFEYTGEYRPGLAGEWLVFDDLVMVEPDGEDADSYWILRAVRKEG